MSLHCREPPQGDIGCCNLELVRRKCGYSASRGRHSLSYTVGSPEAGVSHGCCTLLENTMMASLLP